MKSFYSHPCSVCGSKDFSSSKVLWPELVRDWQLSDFEAVYVDRQQGETCTVCGSNLRSIALADAIKSFFGKSETLVQLIDCEEIGRCSILEINEAGTLSPHLKLFSNYTYGGYRAVDMHDLPYENGAFDLVVHSDTLEHVENPVHALTECRRVLRTGGALCFTVPVIVGRMTKSRAGLKPSYHGTPESTPDDFLVHTEFGADTWTYLCEAGFRTSQYIQWLILLP